MRFIEDFLEHLTSVEFHGPIQTGVIPGPVKRIDGLKNDRTKN